MGTFCRATVSILMITLIPLLAGCMHIYDHRDREVTAEHLKDPCKGGGDEPYCVKEEVPQGAAQCSNGGKRCVNPGALCSPPIGGKCRDRVENNTCYCDCKTG